MNNINYIATEIRVAALDTSDMVIREFRRGNYWYFLLMSKGKQIAGAEFVPSDFEEDWWVLNSLFSDSTSGTMILLFSALSKVKKILPSSYISPAASAVVAGIYKRYKNTEVVKHYMLPESWGGRELPDYLRAGYLWSPKLRQIPIKFESITDAHEQKEHYNNYQDGFSMAYSDTKTKRYDLNFLLKTNDWGSISHGLSKALSGQITRYGVLPWLKKNEAQLHQLGLLDKAVEFIKTQAADKNINLQKLEIDSFDPNHEYYGGKVQYET